MHESLLAVLWAKAWPFICAFVGSLLGAWMVRPSTRLEWVLTVLGGFGTSVILAPAVIAHSYPHLPAADPRAGAIYWFFALIAMLTIPSAVRGIQKRVVKWGDE